MSLFVQSKSHGQNRVGRATLETKSFLLLMFTWFSSLWMQFASAWPHIVGFEIFS